MRTRRSRASYHYRSEFGVTPVRKKTKAPRFVGWIAVFVLLATSGLAVTKIMQPIAPIEATAMVLQQSTNTGTSLHWPLESQSAIGDIQRGVLDEKPGAKPLPTASTAKLITALVVLEQKPLGLKEKGPQIVMSDEDMQRYKVYYDNDGSTAVIEKGQALTQYELLQGTLIMSSNNYADSLAVWAFGSLEKYREAAQQYVQKIGAEHTTIGSDASGYAPDTVSTAHDLVLVGIEAYKHPVLREIMAQKSVTLPLNQLRNNTNWLIGESGVVGGKTGNSDQAGGVFVGIGQTLVDGQEQVMVAVVQGEKTPYGAIEQTERLLNEAYPLYKTTLVFKRGSTIATYSTPWGETYDAVTQSDLTAMAWNNHPPRTTLHTFSLTVPVTKQAVVGNLQISGKNYPLKLTRDASAPTWLWRLTGKMH